ncbi:MAGUK p55 subfamily member 4-like isoform X2 [Corythoichthys intestinalis]|uniref:MAGUK p55 subfamily member 4-like isoform X2 n=1 Tax=Corythoichthys intestinalis TaxID=161448 RepID=UPI0025A66CB7|nr:MAGUK p55 subfamily member 4-like isoform X2 [Corythoichthys intestinalis]
MMTHTVDDGLMEVLSTVVEEASEAVSRNVMSAHLYQLLSSPWLRALLQVYECLLRFRRLWPRPLLPHAFGLSREVQTVLHTMPKPSTDAAELHLLLSSPHMKALLSCHDTVAQADFDPVLAPLPDESLEDLDAVRIVLLDKNEQPLGATIRKDKETGEILIARVIRGGLADRSGLLHAGDLLVEVDGKPLVGLEPEQVIQILMRSEGAIQFKVIPNVSQLSTINKPVYVRALVDYCPLQDPSIPCPDVGVIFSKGDVLEVLEQSDEHWWQARKITSTTSFAGLIPSPTTFRSKQKDPKECAEDKVDKDERVDEGSKSEEEPQDKGTSDQEETCFEAESSDIPDWLYLAGFRRSFCLLRRSLSKRRRQSCTSISASCTAGATPYEEVVLYRRAPQDRHRLIILIGTPGVCVNELRQNLIKLNPDTFQGPVPHTTRPIRAWEETGRDYHFVNKELFDYMVCSHRFVEYGEYAGHKYGTSIDAINEVIKEGHVCIIDIEPHNISSVRTRKYKPFVIFIKAPSLDKLAHTRGDARVICSYQNNKNLTMQDLADLAESSRQMELKYKHLFDEVFINEQLTDTCAKLHAAVSRAQEEANWIPSNWT